VEQLLVAGSAFLVWRNRVEYLASGVLFLAVVSTLMIVGMERGALP
jgi:hypothetical protein